MPPSVSDAIFWLAVVCCAIAQLLILRSVFGTRGMASPAPGARALPPVRRSLEIASALLPAVGLAIVLAMTWRAIHPRADDPRPLAPLSDARGGALT